MPRRKPRGRVEIDIALLGALEKMAASLGQDLKKYLEDAIRLKLAIDLRYKDKRSVGEKAAEFAAALEKMEPWERLLALAGHDQNAHSCGLSREIGSQNSSLKAASASSGHAYRFT